MPKAGKLFLLQVLSAPSIRAGWLPVFSAFACVFLLQFPATTYAQNEVYSFKLTSNQKLPDLLGHIEAKYNIVFSFSYTDLKEIEVEAGNWEGQSIESFLFKLLEPYQIIFRKSGKRKYLLRLNSSKVSILKDWDMYLEGMIFDRENRIPLSQVAVFIEETGIGTLSDEQGRFQLKIPRQYEDAMLSFKLFSYKQLKLQVGQASLRSVFPMKAEPLSVNPIKIQSSSSENPELDALNVLPLNWQDIAQASNLAGPDVLRTLQLLPGINAFDDMNAELKIRGSGGDETLVVLDGIPIYRTDHYFGIFSSISSNYLDKVELYKNILPLEYGGKTGGMILMKGPERIDEFSAKLDLNLMSASANLRIPFGKGNSLILNGRSTLGNAANTHLFENLGRDVNLDLQALSNLDFSRLNLIKTEPDFRFYDGHAKLNLALSENSDLRFSLFHSFDKLNNSYQLSFSSRNNGSEVENQESFTDLQSWETTGVSAEFSTLLTKKLQLNAILYNSNYQETTDLITRLTRRRRFITRTFERINERENQLRDLGAGLQLKGYLQNNSWEIGANVVNHNTLVDFEQTQFAVLEGEVETYEWNAFSNVQLRQNKWLLDIGYRLNYYALTQNFYFSPRLQGTYQLSQDLKFKAAWGISNQFIREVQHENQWGRVVDYFVAADETNYPVGRSQNFMLGLSHVQGPWTLDIEAFYRNMDGVVEHALINPGLDSLTSLNFNKDYRLYVGEGTSRGIDVYLGYQSKKYASWIAYTLSQTQHQFEDVFGGQPFSSQNDRRHQVKWVNSLSLGKFSFSANLIYTSGRAYLDISDLKRLNARSELDPEMLINRLPYYARIDLGASYRFRLGKSSGSIGISIFNLANRENVDYLQYIFEIPVSSDGNDLSSEVIGSQSTFLDRTLNLNLSLDLR
ncbi:MAG: carboxypeptidase-like regulatory domain-containing protein [Bacteroidota bacterium]